MVSYNVLFSKVNECISPRSKSLRVDVSHFLCSAIFINSFWIHQLIIDDHFSLANNVNFTAVYCVFERISISNYINTDVWIELLQFFEAGLSSAYFADM